MVYNASFIRRNLKDLPLLYLYARLRRYASHHGGMLRGFEMTKHERYELLPVLSRMGLVTPDRRRIINHRMATKKGQRNITYVSIRDKYIESLNAFKGFIVAFAETSLVLSDCEKHGFEALRPTTVGERFEMLDEGVDFTKRMSDCSKVINGIVGRRAVSIILGVSESTVKRWRKHSPNHYKIINAYGKSHRLWYHSLLIEERPLLEGIDVIDYRFGDDARVPRPQVLDSIEQVKQIQQDKDGGFLSEGYNFTLRQCRKYCVVTTTVEIQKPKIEGRFSSCWKQYHSPASRPKSWKFLNRIKYDDRPEWLESLYPQNP